MKNFNCIMFAICFCFVISCNKMSTGDKILSDSQFFQKEILPVVEEAKINCKEKLDNFSQGKEIAPGSDFEVMMNSRIDIPESLRPDINEIEKKYGKPTRIELNIHYYEKIGFEIDTINDNKVIGVIFLCGKHFKKDL